MGKKVEKVTEGIGYLTGDGDCFCISEMPPEKLSELYDKGDVEKAHEVIRRRVYPDRFFPKGFDDRKVRYKVTVELEEAGE